ncbi:zinc-binding dehydrogenase [SAR202 cluster bacterium AC-409-J13_OGT_754m]|nr:zinc-binding dehydrogenase [SAR202 cluster bacterium AC-409-J13_OGT_754m]
MKSIFISRHGGPEVIQFDEQPDPKPSYREVIVSIRATAINRLDTYVRAGVRGQRRNFPPPLILGGDASGIVVELGKNASKVNLNQRVLINPRITCGLCEFCSQKEDDLCQNFHMLGSTRNGSHAEYISIPESNVYPINSNIQFDTAATLPTTYLPVWNMLMRKTNLHSNETVLVLSSSAGVGTAAVEVSKKIIGAKVIATTSSDEKASKTLELGADHVINYTNEDIHKRVLELTNGRGVDVVVDHVGAEFFETAYKSLRPGGRYGICGVTSGYKTNLQMGTLFARQLGIHGVFMGSKKDMEQIVEKLNDGTIQPTIHQVFKLEQAQLAHKIMEERTFFGKLILTN